MAGADAMKVSLLTLPELDRGPLQIRPRLLSATWHGAPVALTRSQYLLVYVLADRPGWIHSRWARAHGEIQLALGPRARA